MNPVDERTSQTGTGLRQVVDRLHAPVRRVRIGVTQLQEPLIDRAEENDLPHIPCYKPQLMIVATDPVLQVPQPPSAQLRRHVVLAKDPGPAAG